MQRGAPPKPPQKPPAVQPARLPAAPVPAAPRPASRLPAPPVQPKAALKTAPPPRLQPPPLPPVTRPQARPAVQPKAAAPPSRLPAPPPPPRRTPPPAPPLPGATVAQGVLIKKKNGRELTDDEVEDAIVEHRLKSAGAKQLRAAHKNKRRRLLATAVTMAKGRDEDARTGRPNAPANRKAKRRRIEKFSKAATDRLFKEVTVSTKVTFKGRWTQQVTWSGARSFASERDAQVLRHLSAQLFWYIRNKLAQTKEQEVQAMAVNNRILVAANLDSSIAALAEDLKKSGKGHLKDLLSTQHENDERSRGNAKKLSNLFEGKRQLGGFEAVDSLIAIAANDAFVQVDVSDARGCAEAIVSPAHSQKLILVVGSGDLHAEQKLVLALYQAKRTGATIYGKKRPCATCEATLRFANEKLNLNITHNLNHGGYWATANEGLRLLVGLAVDRKEISGEDAFQWLEEIKPEINSHQTLTLKKKAKRKSLKTMIVDFDEDELAETGYDSASDSEVED